MLQRLDPHFSRTCGSQFQYLMVNVLRCQTVKSIKVLNLDSSIIINYCWRGTFDCSTQHAMVLPMSNGRYQSANNGGGHRWRTLDWMSSTFLKSLLSHAKRADAHVPTKVIFASKTGEWFFISSRLYFVFMGSVIMSPVSEWLL